MASLVTVSRALDDDALAAVVERSAGNPLYAEQLVAVAHAGTELEVPESAERAIGARIDLLPVEDRTRLRRAAVLGNRVDLTLLASITGDAHMAEPTTWSGLSEFVEVADGRLEFTHDLVRLAAYEGLTFSERRALHRAAATALERQAAAVPALLAEHWRHAGDPEALLPWAVRAADDAAAAQAFSDEVRMRRLAAEHAAAAGATPAARAGLWSALAGGCETLARFEEAERAYRRALRLAPTDDRFALRLRMAWLSLHQDATARASRQVAALLRDAATDSEQEAELLVLRSALRGLAGRRAASDADARAAGRTARRVGRRDLVAEASMQLALNADLDDDLGTDEQVRAAVTLLEDAQKFREVAILQLNRGVSHMIRGRWPAALAAFADAGSGCERCGFVLGVVTTDINRAGLLLEQGHLEQALELLEVAVRRARAAGHDRLALFASGSAHRAGAWAGEVEAAVSGLTDDIDELRAHGNAGEADDLEAYLVEVLVLGGRFERARSLAGELLLRLADREGEVVVLTTRRLAAIAEHALGGRGSIEELAVVLTDARKTGATIEIARTLEALSWCGARLEATRPSPNAMPASRRSAWSGPLLSPSQAWSGDGRPVTEKLEPVTFSAMILDRFRVDGKVAVVTGAGRGIGAATAVALAEAGADVLLSAAHRGPAR